ncbi:MAG: HAD hydrolase-like protein, partial [Chloroflexia bacterium]|nr:HAD hydrolase-like protein [Chloroflexia bacterium]
SPAQVVYVGDRLDNDVLPAQAIGMHAVFLRRGPWGYLHAGWPEMATVEHRIDHLGGIHQVIERIDEDSATPNSPDTTHSR